MTIEKTLQYLNQEKEWRKNDSFRRFILMGRKCGLAFTMSCAITFLPVVII
jgi:hypothetical protein